MLHNYRSRQFPRTSNGGKCPAVSQINKVCTQLVSNFTVFGTWARPLCGKWVNVHDFAKASGSLECWTETIRSSVSEIYVTQILEITTHRPSSRLPFQAEGLRGMKEKIKIKTASWYVYKCVNGKAVVAKAICYMLSKSKFKCYIFIVIELFYICHAICISFMNNVR